MASGKTNAMRILDKLGIAYELLHYQSNDGKIDGVSVAEKIGAQAESVFKTLVAIGTSRQLYVFVIPGAEELDLKKAAKAAGEKKIEMLPLKDLLKNTGYIRGGCSPVGMKKQYETFLDQSAERQPFIIVSGGKIGTQMKLKPEGLIQAVKARFVPLIK
ncbi:Cys-tRNA(Pro) deacylase [Bacillus massiliglaciei]|uniref:Cys-tRNA(Pro) deacylase n=1 Tax=Bacillus massiliglaciei TaxID=1816693 RepID=UPI000A808F93|nr:Cys-tRNA(Pro) deacylase [Bacillus massiliglaciei]